MTELENKNSCRLQVLLRKYERRFLTTDKPSRIATYTSLTENKYLILWVGRGGGVVCALIPPANEVAGK